MADTKLRQLRKRTGMSAFAISQELEKADVMTRDYYYKLEQGRHRPSADMQNRLAVAFAPHLNMTPLQVLAELTGINEEAPA